MLHKIISPMFALVFIASPCFGQEWASKMFKTTEHDFGTVAHGAKAEYRFAFENPYVEDVHIANAYTSCSCTTVRVETPWVKTYGQGVITAHLNTDSSRGRRGATITVVIDKPYPAEVQLHVSGHIRGDVSVEPGSVELGSIDEGSAVDWTLAVKHVGDSNWQIVDAQTSNPHVSAEVVETGRYYGNVTYDVKVHVDENAPAGYLNDHVVLVTNDGQSRQIPVSVEGRIAPSILVSPTTLFMGVVQPNGKATKQFVVKGKTPFRIRDISCDGNAFQFQRADDNRAKKLHLIPVTFQAGDTPGKATTTIRITTDQNGAASEFTAYAIVAEDETPQSPE